ncbi:UNVERIFIED_ORG: peptide/nickel transport system permease protein [Nocardia globerula]|uniref:Peptide/nickel transport system permease protein n=1 Tax=Nocardia globerula TaxID=1818 RepID=A0A652YJX0_NOCGL|nr:ABC transporter permease [Rhodococcus globerulus]NMD61948.1 ABC transporter permease [Nocardia globerula]PVX65967.1 peptide/nickel transport system permease protein [Rhodococcus globerulus]
MRNYTLKRIGQSILVMWAAYTLSFFLLSALPGDAVNNRIQNPEAQLSPESARALVEYYGLDRPLLEQYVSGLGGILRGDLGYSLTNGTPVTGLIGDVLPSTLQLTGLALVFGLVLAAVIAVVANYAPWASVRSVVGSVPALFGSVPTFVVGILVLQFLSFKLHVIPSSDDGSFLALLAPAATLAILIAAPLAQVFSTSITTTRDLPFVHVLHAKGAGEGYAFRRGVLRNSALPVLTLLGLACGELIAGSVVTEAVYARPGLGQLTVNAVGTQDLPVLQGVVLVAALAYVAVNLAVDLAYPYIDPRVLVDGRNSRVTARRARTKLVRPGFGVKATGVASVPVSVQRRLPAEVSMP